MTLPGRSERVDEPSESLRVLVADNEITTREALEAGLRFAGIIVAAADDGEEALHLALNVRFDIIVVDRALPLKNGLMVCEELRANNVQIPVVMLSADDQVEDKLRAFSAGADDYLTKPVDVMELVARIWAVMRRTLAPPRELAARVYEFGDLRVDTNNAAVWRGDERLRLSMMEYELLQFLVRHPGEVLPRQRILEEVWNLDSKIGSRTVDMHISWLRKKIGDDWSKPRWIHTIHGKGYSFAPE